MEEKYAKIYRDLNDALYEPEVSSNLTTAEFVVVSFLGIMAIVYFGVYYAV